MQNLKIRVNNEVESKEAQELFFELGESLGNGDHHAVMVQGAIGLAVIDGLINFVFNEIVFSDIKQCKEITLPELRDMVNQEQDEPFLTPESTLNDQYAEIEEVRQHKKQERNSSAWDTQVGGDHYKQFKIQPMQFALENKLDAAQQNVIKYIMRHSFKNGKQDLEKAKHYIDLMIEFYYGDNNNG